MLPVVAIVGRPNVGKSSLFNRLIGKRKAIESDVSGTTRDQISARVPFYKAQALLVDTGGMHLGNSEDPIEADVQEQARTAIEGADLVIFVLDVRHDPTSDDFHAAELLRKSGKPTVMVANKCDHLSRLEERTYNFYELGFGEPVAISAIHGTGLDELRHRVEEDLEALGFQSSGEVIEAHEGLRLAFVGRPNVGKSSLVNALFGKEKVIVSNIPGTTRDTVEIPFAYNDQAFVLVDTAGIRRRGKVEQGIEKYSVLRSFQAIDEADIAILVIDAEVGIRSQDLHVCEFVLAQNKGLILVVNKMDVFPDQDKARNRLAAILRSRMPFVPWAPVVFTSALHRKNLFPILDLASQIGHERSKQVNDRELAYWFDSAVTRHVAAGGRGAQRAEVLEVKQTAANPPEFTFQVRFPDRMHFSYTRYLENSLRERFGFWGTGIKMIFGKASARGRRTKKERLGFE